MFQDEFEEIVESVPDLGGLGASAPDGFMVLVAVDGSRCSLPRIEFIEHANAVCDALKDPGSDLGAVVSATSSLGVLARRVVLEAGWQYFKDWYLSDCPTWQLHSFGDHAPRFALMFRAMCDGAPAYSGEFFYEGLGE